jgi:hypothetical protein
MNDEPKRIEMSMEQFDDALKARESRGATRSLNFAMVASVPLVLLGGFFSSSVSSELMLGFCVTYYCVVAATAIFTQ